MWKISSGEGVLDRHPLLSSSNDHTGRHIWTYDPEAGTPEERAKVEEARDRFAASRFAQKDSGDALLRLQHAARRRAGPFPVDRSTPAGAAPGPATVTAALRNGISYFESLQQSDGCWVGDFSGPLFQLPPLLIALLTTGALDTVLTPHHKVEMIRYLRNHQNEDGGWGRHIHAPSGMLGTALCYVALRLLGVGPDEDTCETARAWIHARGGATSTPSMGKFWLAVAGVYEWAGMNPAPPETALGPYAAWTGVGLLHPSRFCCHARMVFFGMAYVYGRRGTAPRSPLTDALRQELYVQPYGSIDWDACRNLCAKEDALRRPSWVQTAAAWVMTKNERILAGSPLRKRALAECLAQLRQDDSNTAFIGTGPMVKPLSMVAAWLEDPGGEALRRHLPRVADNLWVAEDGMKMQGYNGSQLWDTSFAVQAVAESGLAGEFPQALAAAGRYIEASQVTEEIPGSRRWYYRQASKGGWTFSTRDAYWIVSDCSAEALKAVLALERVGVPMGIPSARLFDCVGVILGLQNADGGWPSFERARSFPFVELFNPSEMFEKSMIDYSHTECSSSCVTALTAFAAAQPGHRAKEISRAVARGIEYVKGTQRPDGSWYGFWGVCFTYGTWFGLEALAAVGEGAGNSAAARAACEFLLSKQRGDGGWAESHLSCERQEYVEGDLECGASHAVQTAWALLGLIAGGWLDVDRAPLDAAARCLIALQAPDGDWHMQRSVGAMAHNYVNNYAAYRNVFPIWALGRYRTEVVGGGE